MRKRDHCTRDAWGRAMPRVKLTRWSKAAITFLEFYLVVLLLLIIVRFLGVVK